MDDKHAFERQLAAEIDHQVGPPRPVDALAITRAAATPTPRWRMRLMLSPARAVTFGALAFAIGGALVVAQPFQQDGGTRPAALTQVYDSDDPDDGVDVRVSGDRVPVSTTGVDTALSDEAAGTIVSGEWAQLDVTDGGVLPPDPGMTERMRNGLFTGQFDMSDARLSGDATFTDNLDRWADDVGLFWSRVIIENDEGSWTGTSVLTDGQDPSRPAVSIAELVGQGGYEGWSAILFTTLSEGYPRPVHGLVFPGDLPPDR